MTNNRAQRSSKASKKNTFDTFVSKDGRIKATVSATEARIHFKYGEVVRLYRLENKPSYANLEVRADLVPKGDGFVFALPGITLEEVWE